MDSNNLTASDQRLAARLPTSIEAAKPFQGTWPHPVLIIAARRATSQQLKQSHFQSVGCKRKTPPRDRGEVFRGSAGDGLLPSTLMTTSKLTSSSGRRYRRVAGLLGLFKSLRLLGSYF